MEHIWKIYGIYIYSKYGDFIDGDLMVIKPLVMEYE